MRKPVFYSLVILSAVSLVNCTRAQKNNTKIIFEMPPSASKVSATSVGFAEPTSMDELNCFYVAVVGPEDNMSDLICGQSNADKSITELFRAGKLIGGVPRTVGSATAIEAEVPSGADREFILLGIKRQHNWLCQYGGDETNFYGTNPTSARSSVYILGRSEKIHLEAGSTSSVSISSELKPTQWISECRRSSAAPGEWDTQENASFLFMTKSQFPASNRTIEDTCVALDFDLKNSRRALATLGTDITVEMQGSMTDTTNFTTEMTFASYNDCMGDPQTNSAATFTIPAGATSTQRFIKMPQRPAGLNPVHSHYVHYRLVPSVHNVKMSLFAQSVYAYTGIFVEPSTALSYDLQGPNLLVKDQCYKFFVGVKEMSQASSSSLTAKPYKFSNIRNYKIYSDASCSTEITQTTSISLSTIYVKPSENPGGPTNQLVITPSVFAADAPFMIFKEINTVGTPTPAKLVMYGPRVIKNTCTTMWLSLANSFGAVVPNNTGSDVTVTVTTDHTFLYPDSTCGTGSSNTKNVVIPDGETMVPIYVRGHNSVFGVKTMNMSSSSPSLIGTSTYFHSTL